jgi:DNA-directed RNA polymerase subunit M/transcription elongation factor TFIIS
MLVKYECPKCGHDKARFYTVERKPSGPLPTAQIGETKLEMNPPFDIHLKCLKCGAETVLENAYMEKMETDYGPDVVVDEGTVEIETVENPEDEHDPRS